MNIALVVPGVLISRKEATWLTLTGLAEEFQRHGHSVCLIARRHPARPQREEHRGFLIYRLYSKTDPLAVVKTLHYLQQKEGWKADLLHGFSSSPTLALELWLAARYYSCPFFHTIKSYSHYPALYLATPFLNFAAQVTVPNHSLARHLRRWCCRPSKIKIIHSNIDTQRFRPRNRRELRKKYGLTRRPLILYYGALRDDKGVDTLLQAIPPVLRHYPQAQFLLLGRSPDPRTGEKYRRFIQAAGIGLSTTIILDDVEIEEWVSAADVVVLPYSRLQATEGNPSCLLESMAAKIPVVTTALPELQEIVADGEEVFLARPNDHFSLAEKIVGLLSSPSRQRTLVTKAFQKSKQFDTRLIAREYLQLYAHFS